MQHSSIASPLEIAKEAIERLSEQDKLAIIADLLSGGFDMSEDLADALLPLDNCLYANLNSLRAAVGEE